MTPSRRILKKRQHSTEFEMAVARERFSSPAAPEVLAARPQRLLLLRRAHHDALATPAGADHLLIDILERREAMIAVVLHEAAVVRAIDRELSDCALAVDRGEDIERVLLEDPAAIATDGITSGPTARSSTGRST